ncbi:MAG: heme-copper oxidase subunit III, partial [Actinomycetota bacterium]|nr:heme-copper oxidase subunit III [Actinomycetota bacterium]
ATLFGTLFASYFYIRFKGTPVWPPDGIKPPELALPLIMTAILLSSSIPMFAAERAMKKDNMTWVKIGLAVTFVLGATFLVLQLAVEYPEKLKEFTPQTDAYGSFFFTITGFHGMHVAGGLLMNLWTQIKVWRGRLDSRHALTLENSAIYWHFVDLIWIFVLASLYLAPKF